MFFHYHLSTMTDHEIKGKAKGGVARAAILSSEQRKEIAKNAAKARWSADKDDIPMAAYGSIDKPLRIGDLTIPCYVLEDGRRVLVQRGMLDAMDMKQGTAGKGGGDRLSKFVATKAMIPFVSNDLADVINKPILFTTPGGSKAYGYEATVLADLCDAVLSARKNGKLNYQQKHIAIQCEILIRAFAKVGIIALVDEATGYQNDRAKDALAAILEAFIAKELQPWVKTFPSDYYQELFRLRGLNFPTDSVKRPQYFGILTNDIIYKRLAPGVLEELKKETQKNNSGRSKHKLFQKLTTNVGYPKLREHLGAVIAVMRFSDTYQEFITKLDRHYPRYGETSQIPFSYEQEYDEGKGI